MISFVSLLYNTIRSFTDDFKKFDTLLFKTKLIEVEKSRSA
ncbi:MAG: hypothetical protein ACRC2T_03235 [Thermoguttaceae bacterium]